MPTGNKLFDLIRSLSKTEKRYFRMRASFHTKGETNQYMQLFERIDRQQEYDEAELLRELGDGPIAEHLAEAKYYLYNAILKSLHTFHADRSVTMRIQTLIHQAQILLAKGLYDQCPALLAKARKLAITHELWSMMPSIMRVEYNLLMLEMGVPGVEERLERLFETLRHYQELEANRDKYWGHHMRMFARYRALGMPRSEKELAVFRSFVEEEMMRSPELPLTSAAKMYYYQSHALYSDLRNDFEGTLQAHLAIHKLITGSPRRYTDDLLIPTLFNICVGTLRGEMLDHFFTYYPDLLHRTERYARSHQYRKYINALGLRASLFCLAGYFEDAVAGMREIESKLVELGRVRAEHDRDHVATLGVVAYFGCGDYARCLDYLNELMSMKSSRENVQLIARTLALIVHFELRRFDLLEYLLKSTYKYLLSKEKLFGFERAVIEFIRGALNTASEAELLPLFRSLHERLVALTRDPFERIPVEIVDVISWLQAKIEGRMFAEVVRERFRARHGDLFTRAREAGAAKALAIPSSPTDWQSAA